jgi:hypothetical protein
MCESPRVPTTPLDTVPTSATQGDSLAWRVVDDRAVPGSGWTVRVRLATVATSIDHEGTPDGRAWLITVGADDTRRLAAGEVQWYAIATHADGSAITLQRGSLWLDRLPLLGEAFDPGWRRRRIAQLQEQLLRLDHLESYSNGDRQAKRLSSAALLSELREHERALLLEEGGDLGAVQMVFR